MHFEPRQQPRVSFRSRSRQWFHIGKEWLCRGYCWVNQLTDTIVRLFRRLPLFWQKVILWLLKLIIGWFICWCLSKIV